MMPSDKYEKNNDSATVDKGRGVLVHLYCDKASVVTSEFSRQQLTGEDTFLSCTKRNMCWILVKGFSLKE